MLRDFDLTCLETPTLDEQLDNLGTSTLPADDYEQPADAFPAEAELSDEDWAAMEADYRREQILDAELSLTEQLTERACAWGLRWDEAFGKAG